MSGRKKRAPQPVTLKNISTSLAMQKRVTQIDGCNCNHRSHRGGRCNAPIPGSI